MKKLQILQETLKKLEKEECTKRENWVNSGASSMGDAYNDWNSILVKIGNVEALINIEEKSSDFEIQSKNDTEVKYNDNNESKLDSIEIKINKFEDLKNKIQHYDATQKDAFEYLELRDLFLKRLIDDYDNILSNSKILNNTVSEMIFHKIVSSETLSETVKLDINKIRENKYDFKDYHRAIVVSALTISIIKYSKFDYRKADFLIDFLSDKEDNIWERALVGLYISLMYRDNKWLKYNLFKERLLTLKNDEKIQEGLYQIDQIWRLGLYRSNILFNNFKDIDFFNDKPHNWFMLFYEDNPVLIQSLENAGDEIDTNDFKDFIFRVPFTDSFKYLLCDSLVKGRIKKVDKANKDDIEYLKTTKMILELSLNFYPYQNIISNLFLFYSANPEEQYKDLFSKKKSIIETNLRNTILNRKQKLIIKSSMNLQDENYEAAKLQLRELMSFDNNDPQILLMMSECLVSCKYNNELEFEEGCYEALKYLDDLENMIKSDYDANALIVYLKKRDCYKNTDQFSKALDYSLKIEKINPDNISYKCVTVHLYSELEINSELTSKLKEIDEDLLDSVLDFHYLGLVYTNLQRFDKALIFHKKAYDLFDKGSKNEKLIYLLNLILTYSYLKDNKNVKKYLDIAEAEYFDDMRLLGLSGRLYLLFFKDFEEATKRIVNYIHLYKQKNFFYKLGLKDLITVAIWEIANNEIDEVRNTLKMILHSFDSFSQFKTLIDESYDSFVEYSSYNTINNILEELELYWKDQANVSSKVKSKKKLGVLASSKL